jgi:aerobic-type carbon monoxide dehydrogenase small subunit (CoxS/CutS family)
LKLDFRLNKEKVSLEIEPGEILADILRDTLGMTGTKISCREGECGSCTVLVDGLPINSCIFPAAKVMGKHVTTIEGLGNQEMPHAIQERIAAFGGSQCGYCTPGFSLAAAALLEEYPEASIDQIIEGLSGNLCRCTGYKRIVAAIESLANPAVEIPKPNEF